MDKETLKTLAEGMELINQILQRSIATAQKTSERWDAIVEVLEERNV